VTADVGLDVRWLDDDEQSVWRSFLAAQMLLLDQLNHDLQTEHGLSLQDYDVLVQLSEAPERRLRMSQLADRTYVSRSRLSHQVTRMERAGLVAREDCDTDRRGQFAVLSDEGWRVLEKAAPSHVASVRRHVFDVVPPNELRTFGRVCATIAARLATGAARAGDA
jgi:DNA-binding MarR family transcriptional regulator